LRFRDAKRGPQGINSLLKESLLSRSCPLSGWGRIQNEAVIAALKCVRENLCRPSRTRSEFPLYPGLTSLCENSVVPPGLESCLPLYPALKRWAKVARPSGAGFSGFSFHRIGRKLVPTQVLTCWALQCRRFAADAWSIPPRGIRIEFRDRLNSESLGNSD